MIAIGIDNGLLGAVVALRDPMTLLDWWDTPIIEPAKCKGKKAFAPAAMATILNCLKAEAKLTGQQIMVFVEYAQSFPKQGLASTFKTGMGYGLWQGICAGLELPYEVVNPRTWQKQMLADLAGDTKARSLARCQQLFSELPLMKPRGRKLTMDGRSDAALIAAFGLKRMQGR